MNARKLIVSFLCTASISCFAQGESENKQSFMPIVKTDNHMIFIDSNSVLISEIDSKTTLVSANFKMFNRAAVIVNEKPAQIFEMTIATDCKQPQVRIFNNHIFDKTNSLIADFPNIETYTIEKGDENDLSLISVSYKTLCYLSKNIKPPVQI